MADPRSTPTSSLRNRLRRAFPMAPMLAATFLGACGNPQSGGGTELPISVQIYVGAQARAWRLWSVEETPAVAARGQDGSGYTFVSRGVLRDSAGMLDLPTAPGTFLLEAWINHSPSAYLTIARPAAAGFAIDPSCVQTIPLDGQIISTRVCPTIDRLAAPSGLDDTSTAPDRLTLIRIGGTQVQRVQILDDAGTRRLQPVEARLWSVSTDTSEDQTLVFRGRLQRENDGTFRLPTTRGSIRYVIEASDSARALPPVVPAHAQMDSGWSRYLLCQENILTPLPGTLSVHACPGLDWTPSGRDSTHVGAGIWSVFSLDLP